VVCVNGQFVTDGFATHRIARQYFEVPSTEKTKYISKAAVQEMYGLLANTVTGIDFGEVSRITFADVLQEFMNLQTRTHTDTATCLAILPLMGACTYEVLAE